MALPAHRALARYLDKHGLTHEEFGISCGLSRSMVSRIVRGGEQGRLPGRDAALAIERATGIAANSWGAPARRTAA